MMVKIKEIKILEPKIKEIKKEKEELPEEEIEEEETFEDFTEFENEGPKNNLRRRVNRPEQRGERKLEEKLWDTPTKKEEDETENKPQKGYQNKNEHYQDSSKAYDGSGNKTGRSNEVVGGMPFSERENEDNIADKYKPAIKQRKEENPFDNSNNGIIRHRPGR